MRQFAKHKRFVPKVIHTVGEDRIEILSTQFVALQMALPEYSQEELNWVINHAFDGEFRDFWEKFGTVDAQELFGRIKRCKFVKFAKVNKTVNGVEVDDEVIEFRVSEKLYKFTGNLQIDPAAHIANPVRVKLVDAHPASGNRKRFACAYPGCMKDYANSGALWNHQHNHNHIPSKQQLYKPAITVMSEVKTMSSKKQKVDPDAVPAGDETPAPSPESAPETDINASTSAPTAPASQNPEDCPFCGAENVAVAKEWEFRGLTAKRHECSCGKKFNTYYGKDGTYKYTVKN